MRCCGGRRGGGGGNPGSRVKITEQGDTLLLEYIGDKRGTMSVRGPISKKWYTFSAAPVNRRFHAARADAEYMLRRNDLRVVPQAAEPMAAPQPPAPRQVRPAPMPQIQAVAQPTMHQEVRLEQESPADDLSEIKGITKDTAGILALIGIRTFEDLTNLENVKAAARLVGKSEKQVEKWVAAVREEAEIDLGGLDSGEFGDLGVGLLDDVQLADGRSEDQVDDN